LVWAERIVCRELVYGSHSSNHHQNFRTTHIAAALSLTLSACACFECKQPRPSVDDAPLKFTRSHDHRDISVMEL
jgi:hypothetical protein